MKINQINTSSHFQRGYPKINTYLAKQIYMYGVGVDIISPLKSGHHNQQNLYFQGAPNATNAAQFTK